jgi:hypothetical protein
MIYFVDSKFGLDIETAESKTQIKFRWHQGLAGDTSLELITHNRRLQ